MKKKETRKFGLLMSIAMIIGIVIGSGIFFKADDILLQTDGNVAIGCIVLIIGAMGIIFGGITIAEWAKVTDDAGGLISYGEKAFGKEFAFIIGWFQTVVYFPALSAVVCWVAGNYTIMLFPDVLFLQDKVWWISVTYMILIYFINSFSTKIAGYFQTSAMFIKLIPLILIAVFGVLFGDSSAFSSMSVSGGALFASSGAIVAAAFSYDGWSIAPSICHEIKDSKRNLPLALLIAPVIIMIVYLLYFLGINFLIGPEKILELQDGAFNLAALQLFGPFGAKILLICVVISVLGTANGIILGGCRIPYSLAIRKEIPYSDKVSKLNEKYGISVYSNLISFMFTCLWLAIHFITMNVESVKVYQIDISGIPIVIMYIFYTILFVGVIQFAYRGNIKNKLFGYVFPVLAILGALVVIYGGLISSNAFVYVLVSILVILTGVIVYKYEAKRQCSK